MIARCTCGSVEVEAVGAPILSVACYRDDCQEGSRQIEALPGAGAVLDPDSGTSYTLYRKDRVRYSKGAELLKSLKNPREDRHEPGRRHLLQFGDVDEVRRLEALGSGAQARFGSNAPPLEMRICTKFKTGSGALPTDVPSYPGFSLKFVGQASRRADRDDVRSLRSRSWPQAATVFPLKVQRSFTTQVGHIGVRALQV